MAARPMHGACAGHAGATTTMASSANEPAAASRRPTLIQCSSQYGACVGLIACCAITPVAADAPAMTSDAIAAVRPSVLRPIVDAAPARSASVVARGDDQRGHLERHAAVALHEAREGRGRRAPQLLELRVV